MRIFFRPGYFGLLVSLFILSSCSVLQSNFQPPSVALVSIAPGANIGLEQQFTVGLRITNPNATALNLVGLTYALELEGAEIIRGAANDIPGIAAYDDGLVEVNVSFGLIEGLKLARELMSKTDGRIAYRLSTRLDTGLPLIGRVPVVDSGVFDINELR